MPTEEDEKKEARTSLVNVIAALGASGVVAAIPTDRWPGLSESNWVLILKALIALGLLAGSYFLKPGKGKIVPKDKPDGPAGAVGVKKPDQASGDATPSEPTVPLRHYQEVWSAYDEWVKFAGELEVNIKSQQESRTQLDTKQTVLRISLYGILGLGFLLMVAALLAPSIYAQPSTTSKTRVELSPPKLPAKTLVPLSAKAPPKPKAGLVVAANTKNASIAKDDLAPTALYVVVPLDLLTHLACLLAAYLLAGAGIGIVVRKVRAVTDKGDAFQAALRSAMVLSVGTTLVALPYMTSGPALSSVTFSMVTMPLVVWLVVFRIALAPFACALAGSFGFAFASRLHKWLGR